MKGMLYESIAKWSFFEGPTDLEIMEDALNALKSKKDVPEENLRISLRKGHLTLAGEVQSALQKYAAEEAVQNLYGISQVTNKIRFKSAQFKQTLTSNPSKDDLWAFNNARAFYFYV